MAGNYRKSILCDCGCRTRKTNRKRRYAPGHPELGKDRSYRAQQAIKERLALEGKAARTINYPGHQPWQRSMRAMIDVDPDTGKIEAKLFVGQFEVKQCSR
jgi:hypothetical protein